VDKLKLRGYPTAKTFEDMIMRLDTMQERDGRMDGHTDRRTDEHRTAA